MTVPTLGFIPTGLENVKLFMQRLIDITESMIVTRDVYVNGQHLCYNIDGNIVKAVTKNYSASISYTLNLDGSDIRIDLDKGINLQQMIIYNYKHSDGKLYHHVLVDLKYNEIIYEFRTDDDNIEEKTIDLLTNTIIKDYKSQHGIWRLAYSPETGYTELIRNGPVYPLLYAPSIDKYIAGCRTFSREQAIKHWTNVVNDDDINIRSSRKERAVKFLESINAHDPTE